MNKTANIRLSRTIEDGVEWYRVTVDIGARHLEPPFAFRTLGGLFTILADLLAEELQDQSSRPTEPELEPVKP